MLNAKQVIVVSMLAVGVMVATINAAQAYAPENDMLHIKNYSPETVQMISTQRSRQEWREPPAAKRTPMENFFHNIYYNDWTGSYDDFGSTIIRGKK